MVEIEVRKTQSITNEQLGKYYAKLFIATRIEAFNEDLATAVEDNILNSGGDIDFVSVVEAMANLSLNDVAEILQSTAQCLKDL